MLYYIHLEHDDAIRVEKLFLECAVSGSTWTPPPVCGILLDSFSSRTPGRLRSGLIPILVSLSCSGLLLKFWILDSSWTPPPPDVLDPGLLLMFWAHPGLGSSWFWAVRTPPQVLVLLKFTTHYEYLPNE
ncbi:hypothetical protein GCK72_005606 [Caenorhabditis remanei]|uniref:Uncharacterized protein n=1 Tax=Caenorhabditis remanei TaxID=31234 RepID=A0A6A5HH04_CAERE|nr:hypothetical protein GCK72_005606 [Caenorhabditis remanei]KAF1765653.1 hypothetical protein GCK72_005606 [Caenorhabditis remanei]